MKVVHAFPWFGVILLCSACQGEEARQREEAARFVELYGHVQYEAPPQVRTEKLLAIEQAVFVTPEVVAARTVCLSGHRQLVDAQRSQEETAKEIDRALSQADGGGGPLGQGVIERLQATLTTAQGKLAKARAELEDCEAKVRTLDVRFGKR